MTESATPTIPTPSPTSGTPCWADLAVSDMERSQAFYATVLGWEFTPPSDEMGGYSNALANGAPVAGLTPPQAEMEGPQVWDVYFATADITATDKAAVDAGAIAAVPPMEVGPFGSMACYVDPQGNRFNLWQAAEHHGFGAREVPGAPAWIDLATANYDAAREFYAAVFGWTYNDMPDSDEMRYAFFAAGDNDMDGGIGSEDPQGIYPNGWSIAWTVDDVDAAAARVQEAGGRVLNEPIDFEFGRIVAASGPDGEIFSLYTPLAQ